MDFSARPLAAIRRTYEGFLRWDMWKQKTLSLTSAVRTVRGMTRARNDDAFGFFPAFHCYIVADGMEKHGGGDIASALVVDVIRRALQISPAGTQDLGMIDAGQRLIAAVQEANARILDLSHGRPELVGMGTTVATVFFDAQSQDITICHVGNSRVYRVRTAVLTCLTEDHTFGQELVRAGRFGAHELWKCAHRHLLTQAVGLRSEVYPDVRTEALLPGDVVLLCTDGVYEEMTEQEIADVVLKIGPKPQRICDRLISLAQDRGGRDDSTVLVLTYDI